MKSLDLSNRNIQDLSSVAIDRDVVELDLSQNAITDSSTEVIGQLMMLRALCIADTAITDLTFLRFLKDLEEIDISGTNISDISIFEELSNLKRIIAHDTLISDLSPLSNLPNLRELRIERVKIDSVDPLGNIRTLEVIDLYGSKDVDDIEVLGKLENLRELCVKGTDIVFPDQLNCLEHLRKLTKLVVNCDIEFAAKAVLRNVAQNREAAPTEFFAKSAKVNANDTRQSQKADSLEEDKVSALIN